MKITLCLTLTLIILTIAGFSSMSFAKDKTMTFIIDVRTVQEWNNGHIEGAILIPYDQIDKNIGAAVRDKSQKDMCTADPEGEPQSQRKLLISSDIKMSSISDQWKMPPGFSNSR